MKFRFYMSYVNAREGHYDASLCSGYTTHLRGWDAGVKVTPYGAFARNAAHGEPAKPERPDEIRLDMTKGSHNEQVVRTLGTIHDTPNGPVWVAALPSGLAEEAHAALAQADGIRSATGQISAGVACEAVLRKLLAAVGHPYDSDDRGDVDPTRV